MNKEKLLNQRNQIEIFLLYCFIGWIHESFLCCMIVHKIGFVNRGFLFGPWLPIYGIGALIVFKVFDTIKIKNPLGIFVTGTLLSAIAELTGSYIAELVTDKPLWDYSRYLINFDGRIALIPELVFGTMIFLSVFFVQPVVVKLQDKYNESKPRNVSFVIITTIFLIDLVSRFWLGCNLKT